MSKEKDFSKIAVADEIKFLPGVGPIRATLLKLDLKICKLQDLIHFFPLKYVNRNAIQKIASLSHSKDFIQINAKVIRIFLYSGVGVLLNEYHANNENKNLVQKIDTSTLSFKNVKRLSVWVSDPSGGIELVWFKGIKWILNKLLLGQNYIFLGKTNSFKDRLNIVHPEILRTSEEEENNTRTNTNEEIIAVYSSTEKLKNSGLNNRLMTNIISNALKLSLPEIQENLPKYLLQEMKLVPKHFALYNIHFPQNKEALQKAQYRLKFEELFYLQLSLLKQKYAKKQFESGFKMPRIAVNFNNCYNSLPFSLTNAQKKVIKEIRYDLKSGKQMNRLLQGDVGSGKTLVAIFACLIAADNSYQSCIMAPTDILARQHFSSVQKLLKTSNCPISAALLTGASNAKERREIHQGLEDGSISILIGTHALIEESVIFKNIGLAIVDEQHRFGVEQRSRLWSKNTLAPHILVMTATPIPRTLAMAFYGDLDLSIINERPPGRQKVKTIQINESRKRALYKFMKQEIKKGRQIFVVYPLVFENEKLDYHNLETGYEELSEVFPFPGYKLAIVYGKQNKDEKKFNMDAFIAGRANILVATIVIEVGVDIPNASTMVIMNAERYGLSQLHQLRGRVGRGTEQAYCILLKGNKISKESEKRLELMCQSDDGFLLAEEDMKMRGPGNIDGTRQSGLPVDLKITSLATDGDILKSARDYAIKILEDDPTLSKEANSLLVKELKQYKSNKDFSNIS